ERLENRHRHSFLVCGKDEVITFGEGLVLVIVLHPADVFNHVGNSSFFDLILQSLNFMIAADKKPAFTSERILFPHYYVQQIEDAFVICYAAKEEEGHQV